MVKDNKSQSEKVSNSVAEIYANLIAKREEAKKKRAERMEEEVEQSTENESDELSSEEDGKIKPMTKEEKRAASFDKWKDVMVNLTGEDIEYLRPSKKTKKYKKWIDEDEDLNQIATKKAKKAKRKNYNKEFEHELNMLKTILTDQNKFSVDLAKRYQIMVGPNNRDAAPLSKNAIELAAVINASRGNSLSFLREIGGIKKSIADLTMKDKKLIAELSGHTSGADDRDLGMMGSNIMSSIFGAPTASSTTINNDASSPSAPPQSAADNVLNIDENFNPDNFQIPGFEESNSFIKYENVPKKTIVQFDNESGKHRYKTINTVTNEEIKDYPNPEFAIKTIDKETKQARDAFDTLYDLEII